MMAKLEIIKPMAVLLTPKDEAKIGIAGIIKPNPTATKKQQQKGLIPLAVIARKDFYQDLLFLFNLPPHQLLQFEQHDVLNYFEVVSL